MTTEEQNQLTGTDYIAYLEMARIAMAAIPEDIADNLDISDAEFLRLREKLKKLTGE